MIPRITLAVQELRGPVGNDLEATKVAEDLEHIRTDHTLTKTTRMRLQAARMGQGQFRADVLARWSNKCAVTGCTVFEAIRASHMKPWALSNNDERLDPDNGLPLVATLDALFDRGLITFEANGAMLMSSLLSANERKRLKLGGRLSAQLSSRQMQFLEFHRGSEFNPGSVSAGV